MLDRLDRVAREQLREQPHHDLAVLEHVGHAGGHAQVVLEYVELAFAGAHHVDAGDVGVDVAGYFDTLHLGAVLRVAQHLRRRDPARLEDLLVVVDVGDEGVQRRDPLAQAAEQLPPFGRGDDARHHVEGDQSLGTGLLAVDGESDADAAEQQVGLGALLRQPFRGDAGQPAFELAVMAAHPPVGSAHLVESGGHGRGVDPGWQPVEAECSHFLARTSRASHARP